MSEKEKKLNKAGKSLFKCILKIFLILLLLLILLVTLLLIFLDPIAKFAIVNIAPKFIGTNVRLEYISIKPLRGRVEIRDLYLDNPAGKGYTSDCVLHLGYADLEVDPASITKPKRIVREITLKDIQINYEADLLLNSNMQDIINYVAESAKKQKNDPREEDNSRLQLDKLELHDVTVSVISKHVSTGVSVPVEVEPMGPLGTGPEGITPTELTLQVLTVLLVDSAKACGFRIAPATTDLAKQILDLPEKEWTKISSSVTDVANDVVDKVSDASNKALDAVNDTTQKLLNLGREEKKK